MIHRAFFLVMSMALLTTTGLAHAQAYRWVDRDGKVQFTDSPPPPWAKDVRKASAAGTATAPRPEAVAPPVPFEVARLQKDFPVTLYTSPNCKEGCDLARGALNRRGVPFKEVQVWDPETNEELKRVSGAVEVPTLLVGRSAQRGFEQGAFDALLDSAGYPKAGILPAGRQKAPPPPEGYVSSTEREAAKPAAQTTEAAEPQKRGLYDPSGLQGPPPKPGQYDPSGLQGPPPKPGQYGLPGESK